MLLAHREGLAVDLELAGGIARTPDRAGSLARIGPLDRVCPAASHDHDFAEFAGNPPTRRRTAGRTETVRSSAISLISQRAARTINQPTTRGALAMPSAGRGFVVARAGRNPDLAAAGTEERIMEDHARGTNPAIRKVESEVDLTTEKLQQKFGEGHGPLSNEEIAAVVRDETEDLQDAPVQAFTSLIAENNARNRLQDLVDDAEHGPDPN
jgi:hypothetical protein